MAEILRPHGMEQTLIKALLGVVAIHCTLRSQRVAWAGLLRGDGADAGRAIRGSGYQGALR